MSFELVISKANIDECNTYADNRLIASARRETIDISQENMHTSSRAICRTLGGDRRVRLSG